MVEDQFSKARGPPTEALSDSWVSLLHAYIRRFGATRVSECIMSTVNVKWNFTRRIVLFQPGDLNTPDGSVFAHPAVLFSIRESAGTLVSKSVAFSRPLETGFFQESLRWPPRVGGSIRPTKPSP